MVPWSGHADWRQHRQGRVWRGSWLDGAGQIVLENARRLGRQEKPSRGLPYVFWVAISDSSCCLLHLHILLNRASRIDGTYRHLYNILPSNQTEDVLVTERKLIFNLQQSLRSAMDCPFGFDRPMVLNLIRLLTRLDQKFNVSPNFFEHPKWTGGGGLLKIAVYRVQMLFVRAIANKTISTIVYNIGFANPDRKKETFFI